MILPRLYVIADAETLARHNMALRDFARQLHRAGVTLVQLRDKHATPASLARDLAILREELPNATLILNDHPHPGFDGVHLGQGDLSPEQTRQTAALIGLSTHSPEQVSQAESCDLAYIAIGPVFATRTKSDAAPVVGLEGIHMATERTNYPIIAIGGITRENCRTCIEVGADSVAVISALFAPNETVEQVARDFLRILS
jgi:thiamine-phosphate pyrophosphorylase